MMLRIEPIDNPEHEYWIGKNHFKGELQVDGKTVAVYKGNTNEDNSWELIAQLCCPDSEYMMNQLRLGKGVDLSWCYIDDIRWLNKSNIRELSYFRANYSIWNLSDDLDFLLAHVKILDGDLSFCQSWFCNVKMSIEDVEISRGNLLLESCRFQRADVLLSGVECMGSRHHRPTISFAGSQGEDTQIDIRYCENPMRIDCSRLCLLENSEIKIADDDASELEAISLDDTKLNSLFVTETVVKHVYARNAAIQKMQFQHCTFIDSFLVGANNEQAYFYRCIISGIMKLNLFGVQRLGLDDMVIAGKLYMDNFTEVLPAICHHIDASGYNIANQLLTLKENFRQLGEYRNEDLCHLYYHRKATKKEPKLWKRVFNNFFDLICGYGTKPFRLLILTGLTILIFALLFLILPDVRFKGAESFVDYLYVSGVTFFTVGYGDVVPVNDLTKIFIIIEAFFGVGMMGCLMALFSRKIIR